MDTRRLEKEPVISIVIPHRYDVEGAFLTAAAASVQLERLGPYEIIFVGDTPNLTPCSPLMENSSVYTINAGSPQAARDFGIRKAKGEFVFCLDSHVVCSEGFFARAISMMELNDKVAMVFPAMTIHSRKAMYYGYKMNWDTNFWNGGYIQTPRTNGMYDIAGIGHGAFLVDKQIYLDSWGYSLAQKGYGGEETFLNLKLWMLGYRCVILPEYYHWHYMDSTRNSGARQTKQFAKNFCIAAYIIGGKAALAPVLATFNRTHPDGERQELEIIKCVEREREQILAGPFGGDLARLRAKFAVEGIE